MKELCIDGIRLKPKYSFGLPFNPFLKERAKALRKARNFSEVIFRKHVHKGKFYNIDFHRQKIIGNYIVDFYIESLSIVIEIDGNSHNGKEEYDWYRDEFFESCGLTKFRVSDMMILYDLQTVLNELKAFIIKNYSY
mgnify:CR=1 FL=1